MTRVLDFLFPRGAACLICGDPLRAEPGDSLCPDCRAALEKLRLRQNLCPRCMTPLDGTGRCAFCARGGMEGLDAAYAAFRYGGAARTLVHLLKFSYQDEAAAALARAMVQAFPRVACDALVPVPLHWRRERARGENQARILCRLISAETGLPVLEALCRQRATRAQSRLDAGERRQNVRGAFALRAPVQGLRLAVVDDVRTTGETARACAAALRQGGAKGVLLLTAAAALRH